MLLYKTKQLGFSNKIKFLVSNKIKFPLKFVAAKLKIQKNQVTPVSRSKFKIRCRKFLKSVPLSEWRSIDSKIEGEGSQRVLRSPNHSVWTQYRLIQQSHTTSWKLKTTACKITLFLGYPKINIEQTSTWTQKIACHLNYQLLIPENGYNLMVTLRQFVRNALSKKIVTKVISNCCNHFGNV